MGLDMYLSRKTYIGGQYDFNNIEGRIDITKKGKKIPIDLKKLEYIEERAGYWRKANAIHHWFVENVQDGIDNCAEYCVSNEQLKELLNICKKVEEIAIVKNGMIKNGQKIENGEWVDILEEGQYIENIEEIRELLPTQEGFFFGSTDYDEYYLYDIKNTIEIIENIFEENKKLDEIGVDYDFYYSSSW